jgi:hypothetical protein
VGPGHSTGLPTARPGHPAASLDCVCLKRVRMDGQGGVCVALGTIVAILNYDITVNL